MSLTSWADSVAERRPTATELARGIENAKHFLDTAERTTQDRERVLENAFMALCWCQKWGAHKSVLKPLWERLDKYAEAS